MSAPHPVLLELAAGQRPTRAFDEDALLASAAEHRMTSSVLSAHLRGELALSRAAGTTLGVRDLDERRTHLGFWSTIAEVQDRLAPLGAEVAVIKGVATEARWYDELGERATTDVDLLLAPPAARRAGEVIDALDPFHGHLPAVQRMVDRGRLQHVDLRVGGTAVDLHFDPLKVGVPTRTVETVWASTQQLPTPHGTITVLRPEIELVLLLLHLNKDRFAYLGPFLDIAHILDRAPLDGELLRGFVHDNGLEVPVWMSLAAVAEVLRLEVEVPPVSGPRARSWVRLWGPGSRLGGDQARERAAGVQRWLALHVRRRRVDVIREIRRRVVPQRELLELAGRLRPGQRYLSRLLPGALAHRGRGRQE